MSKKWIQDAIKDPGALRKQLGIKEGRTIPKTTLSKIANANIGDTVEGHRVTSILKKRAQLAKTLSNMKNK